MPKLAIAVLAGLGLVASVAQAGPPFGCCVCSPPGSGSPLECAALPSSEISDFGSACLEQTGLPAKCVGTGDPASCTAYFADLDCPTAVRAPAAGPAGALLLSALLAGGGILALRRRRAR
jgi:hypothetical protein